MKFQDNPCHESLAHMIGQKVIVQVFGEPVLDPYNPYSPFAVRGSGKRTRGILQEHSETEVKVGEVIFRPDHVSWTSNLIETNGDKVKTYHLHRGHRDDYEYGAPQ